MSFDPLPAPGEISRRHTLRDSVSSTVQEYLQDLDVELVNDLYRMVLNEVEAPLLQAVMLKARSNQSTAARMLGMNRGTLRKKLRQYDLLD